MSFTNLAIIGLISGIIFGLNPILISTISVYTASMIGRGTTNQRYTFAGLLYIIMFGLFVLFFTNLVTTILSLLSPIYSDSANLIIAVLGVITGTNLVRRYFWPEAKIQPPANLKKALNERTTKKSGLFNALALAIISSYATIYTVGMAILLLGSYSVLLGPASFVWSFSFVIGLILPIYFVVALIATGTKASAILEWKEKSKATMRLYSGLALVALSWLLLYLIANQKVIY